jgi:hypothetical protein
MPEPSKRTRGSRALARILAENGPLAERIRRRFDKSVLSRLASGERGPKIETGVALAIVTGGKIPERAWVHPKRLAVLVKG